jgi:hypothetical protein
MLGCAENPKSEYRNPKQTGAKINPKPGKSKTSNPIWACLEFVVFGSFGFVSDFEFRICNFAHVGELCAFARNKSESPTAFTVRKPSC